MSKSDDVQAGGRGLTYEEAVAKYTPELKYTRSIAHVCEMLHMGHTGAGEALLPRVKADCISFLRMRLSAWTEAPAFSARYDAAYRELIEATLAEVDPS